MSIPSKVFVFVGPAGSGKTTLIKKLVRQSGLKFYDIIDVMKPYLKKYGTVTEKNKCILNKVIDEYVNSFSKKKFDILEFATGEYVPKVLDYLNDKKVVLIYCNCPLAVCRKRMRLRERQVPNHYVRYQSKFKTPFYLKLMKKYKFKFVVIDMRKNVETCFNELFQKIKDY